MLIKIVSIAFNAAHGGFDDTELRDFVKDNEIISIKDYLFLKNEVPYLTLVISYHPLRSEADPKFKPQGKRDESWRQQLAESEVGIFNLLRDWRAERCRKDGVPPYIVMTNNQLVEIVKARPQSLADLTNLSGIGKVKAEKYGADILNITRVDVAPVSTPEQQGGS